MLPIHQAPEDGLLARLTAVMGTESTGGGYSQSCAQTDDDCPTHRDGDERAEEAGPEELVAQPGQEDELDGDDHGGDHDGCVVVRDQERQRMEDAPEQRPAARDRTAQSRIAAAGQVSGVGKPLGERHAHAGPQRGRKPCVEGGERMMGRQDDREDGRERGQRPVHEAAEAGLDALKQERLAVELRVMVEARMPHGQADLLDSTGFGVKRPDAGGSKFDPLSGRDDAGISSGRRSNAGVADAALALLARA